MHRVVSCMTAPSGCSCSQLHPYLHVMHLPRAAKQSLVVRMDPRHRNTGLTLLPLMVLLLTCRLLADEDQTAPPSWSALLFTKVQLRNWQRAVVHATAPPTPPPCIASRNGSQQGMEVGAQLSTEATQGPCQGAQVQILLCMTL